MTALPPGVGQGMCRDCGEALIWAKRDDGRRHSPLERAFPEERYFVIDEDGVVRPLTGQVFQRHVCEPPDIDLP